jgi:hypothetical protein
MARNTEREEAWLRSCQRIGEWFGAVDCGRGCSGLEGAELIDVRIKIGPSEDPGVLLVIRAEAMGQRFVAFVGGMDTSTALLTWRQQAMAGTMKWREDRPWSPAQR